MTDFSNAERRFLISRVLTELRKKFNYNQADLARELDISQQTYSRYENGNSEPSAQTIVKLAHFYDVTTDIILAFDIIPPGNDFLPAIDQLNNLQETIIDLDYEIANRDPPNAEDEFWGDVEHQEICLSKLVHKQIGCKIIRSLQFDVLEQAGYVAPYQISPGTYRETIAPNKYREYSFTVMPPNLSEPI